MRYAELGTTRYADDGADALGTMERTADQSGAWRADNWQQIKRPTSCRRCPRRAPASEEDARPE
jgi:hypothetical protein